MFFAHIMATPIGRLVRGAAGLALALFGLRLGGWGMLLAPVGALLFAMAWINVCALGKLFGAPMDWGKPNTRTALGGTHGRRATRLAAHQK